MIRSGITAKEMIFIVRMLCENCHQKEATIHVTQVVNGETSKWHLCVECAMEKGVAVSSEPLDLSQVLENIQELANPGRRERGKRTSSPSLCPACGLTRTDMLKKGRLGCDRCYEAFASEVVPVVISLQHNDQHVGKIPRRSQEKIRQSAELARLRREIEQAVAAENYELAARLRDQIKALSVPEARP